MSYKQQIKVKLGQEVVMSEREEQIFKTFASIIPNLSEKDKDYWLALGEGMALVSKKFEKQQVICMQK